MHVVIGWPIGGVVKCQVHDEKYEHFLIFESDLDYLLIFA